jgi:hypothetical protein
MKKILLSSLSVCSYLLVQSQTFTPEIGFNYMFQPSMNFNFRSFGITYATRFNFWERKNASLSIGFPLSLGLSNLKSPHFAEVDIPVEVDFNFGAGSTTENKSKLGFFAGAGYGFHVTIIHSPPTSTFPAFPVPPGNAIERNVFSNEASDTNSPMSMFGPTLNAGFRFPVGRAGKIIEFRFSYMKVLDLPEFLQDQVLYSYGRNYGFYLQNTVILGFGCLFSF